MQNAGVDFYGERWHNAHPLVMKFFQEQGLFLVITDETMQSEIARIYRKGAVEIYDYRQHPGGYSFRVLQEWMDAYPDTASGYNNLAGVYERQGKLIL